MPRPPRISLEDALYYITNRCIYNQDIFKEKADYQAYFELLKKYKEQYGFKLYAYALMPNHFHLLLELPGPEEESFKGGISEIMHGLNSSYTKYFNGKYGRKGHLFRDRFRTALVEKTPYLLKLTAYIHLNPQKLNLSFSAKDYPYSSYSLYINKEIPLQGIMQNEKNIILSLLGDKNYEQFMEAIIKEGDLGLHNYLQKKGILGGVEFENRVRAKLLDKEGQKEEDETVKEQVKRKGLKIGVTVLVLIIAGIGLTLVAKLTLKENKAPVLKEGKAAVAKDKEASQVVLRSTPKTMPVLDGTKWQITLTPLAGGAWEEDTLVFSQKKFISARLSDKKFDASNYSLRKEKDGKVIWETMQTSPEGIALWRADISESGKMKGVLSLRKEGIAVQDFSFTGAYWGEQKSDIPGRIK